MVVQSLSSVQLFATPWTAAHQASLSFTISLCLNSCPMSHWCHPTISSCVIPFSSCLQSLPALESSSESALRIRWPKYWSFSFSISPSSEYSRLISFRIDWFDLHAVQGISRLFSRTTIQKQQFLGSQHSLWSNSLLYMTAGKTIALTIRTFVSKVMSLLFNMLFRFVIAPD